MKSDDRLRNLLRVRTPSTSSTSSTMWLVLLAAVTLLAALTGVSCGDNADPSAPSRVIVARKRCSIAVPPEPCPTEDMPVTNAPTTDTKP